MMSKIKMDKVSSELVKRIREEVLEQQGERLGIKVQVKEWNNEQIVFTIQLLINVPYIEIRNIYFNIQTPQGDRLAPSSSQNALTFDLAMPINTMYGIAKDAFKKGLQLQYEMKLVVAMKTPEIFLDMPIPITFKGKIKLTKLNKLDIGKIFIKTFCQMCYH